MRRITSNSTATFAVTNELTFGNNSFAAWAQNGTLFDRRRQDDRTPNEDDTDKAVRRSGATSRAALSSTAHSRTSQNHIWREPSPVGRFGSLLLGVFPVNPRRAPTNTNHQKSYVLPPEITLWHFRWCVSPWEPAVGPLQDPRSKPNNR